MVASVTKLAEPPLNTDTVFHKLTTYKTWDALFDSMDNHACLLCVKLNLVKPKKYNQIVTNYLESVKDKYDMLVEQQIQQQQQQIQLLQKSNSNINNNNNNTASVTFHAKASETPPGSRSGQQQHPSAVSQQQHYCVVDKTDCLPGNLCNNCTLGQSQQQSQSNTNLRSVNIQTSSSGNLSGGNLANYSYNTLNSSRNSNRLSNGSQSSSATANI